MSDPSTTEGIERALAAWEGAARAAQAASKESGRWWVDGPAKVTRKWWVYATGERFQHEEVAAHIAANDPAAVLRMVAGIRAVVALAVKLEGSHAVIDYAFTEHEQALRDAAEDARRAIAAELRTHLAAMFAPAAEVAGGAAGGSA